MLYIGNHASSSKGYAAMGRQMVKNGGNTLAFFTRNPRGGKAKELDLKDVEKFLAIAEENHFGKIVAHAPYTMNACAAKEDLRDFAREIMADDMKRMEATPGNYYNFHPGSHVGQGVETGIQKIAEILNDVLTDEQSTTVLLETMAGKGSEVGGRFEEIRAIMDLVEKKEKLGVCLDTCHVWDGGYDILDGLDEVLKEFDRIIGVDRLKAVHINDSKNPRGAAKDRHENLGKGCIGFDALNYIVHHPDFANVPKILETPWIPIDGDKKNTRAPYKEEIAMLRVGYHS